MAGEQQITGPEVTAAMLALPQVAPTAAVESEHVAEAAFETLERSNPNLARLIERQTEANFAAIGRLMTELHKDGPTTPENRDKRNRAVFTMVSRMSVIGVLNAVGPATASERTLVDMFNAPTTQEPTSGGSGDVVS